MRGYRNNQSRRKSAPSISLFPFLAVLICTMGALVPLLFAITRQARHQAAQVAGEKIAAKKKELRADREMALWRIQQLSVSREKTVAQVADARLELGHLEDHVRRLRKEILRLENTAAQLDHMGKEDNQQHLQQVAELDQLRAKLDKAKRELSEAQDEATSRRKTYAVIPYDGPNQTHRRPIYLECRPDAVVLQPEGIEFVESDFDGPLGPGNPLASALRAVREHLLDKQNFDPQRDGEPYPLLLVRPDGIAAYYAARGAMKSWEADFGYELIDADWKLAYPPADLQLVEILRQVVLSARARRRRLIGSAPAAFGKSKPLFRASPTHGGFVRDYGSNDEVGNRDFPRRGHSSEHLGRNYASSGGGYAQHENSLSEEAEARQVASLYGNAAKGEPVLSDAHGASTTGGAATGFTQGHATKAMPSFSANAGSGQYAGSASLQNSAPAGAGSGEGGTSDSGSFGTAEAAKVGSSTATSANGKAYAAANGCPGDRCDSHQQKAHEPTLPEGYVAGRPYSEQTTNQRISNQDYSATERRATALRPGEWSPQVNPPPQQNREELDKLAKNKHSKSLAAKRGRDWALPDTADRAVPITRPIKVQCASDRLVILSDSDRSSNKSVPLSAQTEGSINAFISAIWEHMEAWGIAGRGMYWRPVLNVFVAPGGEQRFAELQKLLDGSGLTVVRR